MHNKCGIDNCSISTKLCLGEIKQIEYSITIDKKKIPA